MSDVPALQGNVQAVASLFHLAVEQGKMSQGCADFLVRVCAEIEKVDFSFPKYLVLPDNLKRVFAGDSWYLGGLPAGRFSYRYEQQDFDEKAATVVYSPLVYSRQDVFEVIDRTLHPADPVLIATLPLAYNVGFLVGWLSALSVAQKEDGKAGMVLLAMLVTPLLVDGNLTQKKDMRSAVPQRASSGRAASSSSKKSRRKNAKQSRRRK